MFLLRLLNSRYLIIVSFAIAALLGLYFFIGAGIADIGLVREIEVFNALADRDRVIKPEFSYIKKIDEGIEMLENSPELDFKTDAHGNLIEKQIAFAVLNTETLEIFEKRAWINENEARSYRQTGRLSLRMDPDGQDIAIEVNWFNSFNSDYRVPGRPEMVIAANKYLLPSGALPAGMRSGGPYSDIVYAPYSGGIHVEEVIQAGIGHINNITEEAFSELESLGVLSRGMSNRLVTESVSRGLVKNIMVVEHVDPDGYNRGSAERRRELAERVLVIVGANRHRAYSFTGSPAGASGLAQFIRPTYDYIVSLYPKANMIKDYRLGMMGHLNAAKAMVLFFDQHIASLTRSISRKDLVSALGISDEMLAASYNGGPARVVRSVNTYGLAWINLHINEVLSTSLFRQETIDYVKKFQYVRGLKLF